MSPQNLRIEPIGSMAEPVQDRLDRKEKIMPMEVPKRWYVELEPDMHHLKKPYTLSEIREKVASNDYNAELLLQHLLVRVAELEAFQREWVDRFGHLATANPPDSIAATVAERPAV